MAKIKSPLLSASASGKLGGVVVFSSWKSRNICKVKTDPSNPKTPSQVQQRLKYNACVQFYRDYPLNDLDKAAWREFAKYHKLKGSEYNLYMGECMVGGCDTNAWEHVHDVYMQKIMGTQLYMRCYANSGAYVRFHVGDRPMHHLWYFKLYPYEDYYAATGEGFIPGNTYYLWSSEAGCKFTGFYKWTQPTD